MGKKNKKKEKSGAEKTSAKTEKNALKKVKKSMKNTGEVRSFFYLKFIKFI